MLDPIMDLTQNHKKVIKSHKDPTLYALQLCNLQNKVQKVLHHIERQLKISVI